MSKTKKIIISLLLLMICGFFYWSYRIEINDYFVRKHVVFWSENVEIQPSDFKAKIDWQNTNNIWWYHALYLKSTDMKDAEVKAVFDQSKSWIKDTTNFKEQMKMQQLRFDLYELFARKFNKEINEVKNRDDKAFSDLEKIGDRIYTELQELQDSIYNTASTEKEIVEYWRPIIDKRLGRNNN